MVHRLVGCAWLVAVGLGVLAAAPVQRQAQLVGQESPQPCRLPRSVIPAVPEKMPIPDSIWAEINAPENIVHDDSVVAGPYPRDLIVLWFRDEATQAERQGAVDLIGAQLIGSAPMRPGGPYFLRICHDGTTGPLHAAIRRLRALPGVAAVTTLPPPLSPAAHPER